jgi:ubiquinone/menaquinone biosynthesis C-methylase UbiE
LPNGVSLLKRLDRALFGRRRDRAIRDFKVGIWQTAEVSEAFVRGSDGASVAVADVMDREVNAYFLEQCQPTHAVLDIGCGHGIVSEYLARHGINVTAMDISETLLDRLRQRVAGLELPLTITKGDAYNIPAATDYFDRVVARMFLPHFPDWPTVLKEMARVTKPGGRVLVHFPSKENAEAGHRLGERSVGFSTDPDTTDPWTFYAEADQHELTVVADRCGLRVVDRVPVSFFLHNRLIGYQIGQEAYDSYQNELPEKLSDERVRDFVVWFDNIVTAKAGPAFSYFSIVAFEKVRGPA